MCVWMYMYELLYTTQSLYVEDSLNMIKKEAIKSIMPKYWWIHMAITQWCGWEQYGCFYMGIKWQPFSLAIFLLLSLPTFFFQTYLPSCLPFCFLNNLLGRILLNRDMATKEMCKHLLFLLFFCCSRSLSRLYFIRKEDKKNPRVHYTCVFYLHTGLFISEFIYLKRFNNSSCREWVTKQTGLFSICVHCKLGEIRALGVLF